MKRLSGILIVALALTLTGPVAQAAVKAGSECKKLSQTSMASGKKFTCVRSGKKLVWNKGVAIKTSSPRPTSTPTPIVDPTALCKLPVADGRGDVSIGGWPRIKDRMRSTGTVIATVVMVDFPDAPATMTPQEAFAKVSGSSDTFAELSYGAFNLTFQPQYKWYRMSKAANTYAPLNQSFAAQRAYMQEAIALADPEVDFSKSEHILILSNPDAKGTGFAGPAFASVDGRGFTLDGNYIANGSTSAYDLNNWKSMWLTHELTHTLGLVDLYAYTAKDSANRYDTWRNTGEFSLMSLNSFNGNSPSLLAFERWNLGWLSDSQILCSSEKEIKAVITPVELKGGLKAVIVPISRTKAVVIESRRAIGLDAKMVKSGALVYVVDSSVPSGLDPVKVFPADSSDPRFLQSPRAAGESVTVEGITIRVSVADDSGDTITITRN